QALDRLDRGGERLRRLAAVLLVDQELADEALARLDAAQHGRYRVEGAVQAVAQPLALLAVGGDRAEEPLALLGTPEDRPERLGDGREVGERLAAALEELLEARARRRRDLAADRHLRLLGRAARELDVLVAEQAAGLDGRARALADHRPPAPDHVVDDTHRAV